MNRYISVILFIGVVFLSCEKNDECIESKKTNNPCPDIYAPVCGCDGVTYGNDCYAKNAGVTEWTLGECDCIDESKISDDYNCDDVYDPVCGCNRITYSNDCHAENAGVTEWTEGECN